jgi:pyruvate formate lyase activating enzyme
MTIANSSSALHAGADHYLRWAGTIPERSNGLRSGVRGLAPPSIAARPALATAGFLHSVETGGAGDGPGMRFIFFFSGCPLRCLYCHNPDTWKMSAGRPVTMDEAVGEVAPYASFLRRAGGVTMSGGEPLTQHGFVGELLKRLHGDLRLHTAVETTGFLGSKVADAWFDAVDLVLLDIKHVDPAAHRKITGRDAAPTLDFARRLVRLGKPMWIRYVLVPGLTDGANDVARLADAVADLGPLVQQVDVLPYHRLGVQKWAELGRAYALGDTPPPTPAQVDAAVRIFAERGLSAS